MLIPTWLSVATAYLGVHLLMYVLVLRHSTPFERERTMFLYHLASVASVGAVLLAWLVIRRNVDALVLAAGVASLHGIYSVTFLELWSLAEGGYSLSILRHIEQCGSLDGLQSLGAIGEAKKMARIKALMRLGLIHSHADRIALTGLGRQVSATFAVIAWLVNTKERG